MAKRQQRFFLVVAKNFSSDLRTGNEWDNGCRGHEIKSTITVAYKEAHRKVGVSSCVILAPTPQELPLPDG